MSNHTNNQNTNGVTTMGKLWWVKITMHGYTMEDVPERHKKGTQAVFDMGGLR